MAVRVRTDEGESSTSEVTSPLMALRRQREDLVNRLYIDLKVPRWDDNGGAAIYVRYRPIGAVEYNKRIEKREQEKPRPEDWAILANADVLIACCEGVYAVIDGDFSKRYSLRTNDWEGSWTKFDKTLAANLGLPADAVAVDVVRALYFTDGDLLDAVEKLMNFSAKSNQEADKDF